ncbi:MAG: polyprenyl synthetase family protein [bacterium]
MDIVEYMSERRALVDEAILRYLPSEDGEFSRMLCEIIRYSVLSGGKRLRPILAIVATELFGGDVQRVLRPCCTIEFIHTASLMWDDLPVMDDADRRRGVLTSHKKYSEAKTMLASAALLLHAIELLMEVGDGDGYVARKIFGEILGSVGIRGMVSGQLADLHYKKYKINPKALNYIHSCKTGKLITTSMRVGAIMAGEEGEGLELLTKYAEHIGMAFQISDDILDEVGDSRKLGKRRGGDRRNRRATFPSLYGLEGARRILEDTVRDAKEVASKFGDSGRILCDLANYIASREA